MLEIIDNELISKFREYAYQFANRKPLDQLEAWIEANLKDGCRGRQKWNDFVAIWNFYTQSKPGDLVLDLGSGTGAIVFNARQDGYIAYGLEPGETDLDFARQKCQHYHRSGKLNLEKPPFIKAVGESLPYIENSLSAIYSWQVLEHVQDIKAVLDECIRVLKPEGLMFISVPNYLTFYEVHYCLFWLPLFPKKLAKIYLRLRKRETEFIDTITYTTRGRILKRLKGQDVLVFDHRLLRFYREFYREFENPDSISSDFRRFIYKATKVFKLRESLEFFEQMRFRLKYPQTRLVMIKKPYEVKEPLMKKIRLY